ncbi:hypothetical protein [Prevotella sp. E2-28]|uniref:hypothetical protein n=1 Tax=Prevotella sp. E2-28 TaxID=2913620 RepID=UPI001ED9DA9A|nr:hypothetical protein [Prevotella sp. E2-28]UKK53312.1 hypothetical protein L6465_12085 [Prevotella sp. E2-28]
MKKLLVIASAVLLSYGTASAQFLFSPHFGVGVGVGTTGIAVDASGTFNSYLGARVGVDIMPKIKIKKELDLGISDKTNGLTISDMNKHIDELNSQIDVWNTMHPTNKVEKIDKSLLPNGEIPDNMDVEGKLNNTTFHVLVDVYPFGALNSFHVTAGAYFGPSEIISVYNKEDGFFAPINQWNNAIITAENNPTSTLNTLVVQPYNLDMIGGELGDYFLTPNPSDNGNVKAYAKVSKFRPYLGIGFGRAVPKNRIGCQFDLGVQFWGKPEIYVPTYDKKTGLYQNEKLDGDKAGDDAGKILKAISKVSVYPVLNFRLVGKIL